MSAAKRTPRDERRRSLGQNFLRPEPASALIADADIAANDLVVEIGAGRGACTFALAELGAHVIALERDQHWADALRREARRRGATNVTVVCCDARRYRMPRQAFRAIGSLPFGATTDLLHHLLDDHASGLRRADLVVQWEVARKRAAVPPTTLLSTAWAPWWSFALGRRLPAGSFRPVPSVDGGVLHITRRDPPLLPDHMAEAYASFVRDQWR